MKYSGTSTSQPYISKVILENTKDKQLKVTVRVALKGGRMLDSMITTIVKVTDPRMIEEFSRNGVSLSTELITHARHPGKFGNLDLSVAEVKWLPRSFKEKEKGFYIATQEFVVDGGIKNLTFYVVCQYNVDHPKYARLASSANFQRKVINDASVVAEDVFRKGTRVKESRAFVYSGLDDSIEDTQKDYSIVRGKRKVWTGPVHYHSSNNPSPDGYVGYVASTPPNINSPRLKLVSSPNSTIHDYRTIEQISRIPFNCRVRKDQPLAHKRNAYFSNLCITSDGAGFVKMFFAVNVGEIIKNNVKLPRFVSSAAGLDIAKASFKEVLNSSIFKKISIQRERVNNLGELLEGDGYVETIAESSQAGLRIVDATTRALSLKNDNEDNMEAESLGGIREIENLFVLGNNQEISNDIRYFTVTDMSMSDRKDGTYRYSVKLDIEDGSVAYLKTMFKLLKEGQSSFEAYYKAIFDGRRLKLTSDHYKNEQGPWVWALNHLIKTIRSFDDHGATGITDLEENLYMLSSPTTCTVASLSRVVELYRNITSTIQRITEELPTKSKRNIEDMHPDTVSTGNRVFPQHININHNFSEFYEATESSGYEYIIADTTNTPGLLTINHENYLSRIAQETLRHFNAPTATSLVVSSAAYSYLTPAVLKLKDNVFNTYFYNRATNVAINNTELANLNALVNLYNYKKFGRVITDTKQISIEETISKKDLCDVDGLFSKNLNSFSMHVKNNLSIAMSNVNALGLKKHESPCFDSTEKEEADYAKLMMPTATRDRYKSEISEKDIRETRVHEETGDTLNLSPIFAPLFYMHFLDISKEICCLVKNINKATNLPHQLTAMTLGSQSVAKFAWYDNNGMSSLKTLNNAAFHYLNNKNLVAVEVFIGGSNWVELKKEHINSAAESGKSTLLCRMRHYVNENICFAQNELLNLNIFNQCFLLDASQVTIKRTRTLKRRIQPIDKITSLDKNDMLKLESNFMRTNLKFGQVVKQAITNRRQRKTRQTTQSGGTTTTAIAASTPSPTMITPTSPGGTSGGGRY